MTDSTDALCVLSFSETIDREENYINSMCIFPEVSFVLDAVLSFLA